MSLRNYFKAKGDGKQIVELDQEEEVTPRRSRNSSESPVSKKGKFIGEVQRPDCPPPPTTIPYERKEAPPALGSGQQLWADK